MKDESVKFPCAVYKFGGGHWTVECGYYGRTPAVFVAPAYPPGNPGESAGRTKGEDRYKFKSGEWVMTFPKINQAVEVAKALTGRDDLVWDEED